MDPLGIPDNNGNVCRASGVTLWTGVAGLEHPGTDSVAVCREGYSPLCSVSGML